MQRWTNSSCSVPRCLDSQGEKLQGVGLSGARLGESLPQHGLKARTSLSPRPSWGDDLSPESLFSWDARGTQWHRCHLPVVCPQLCVALAFLLRSPRMDNNEHNDSAEESMR